MNQLIKNDDEYIKAITSISDNLNKFLGYLNQGTYLNTEIIRKFGLIQPDGSIFRITSSLRSAKDQIKIYKQGREGVKYESLVLIFPSKESGCSVVPANKYELKNGGTVKNARDIATKAWAGKSYHNWGLAVDLCIRKYGYSEKIEGMSIDDFYSKLGVIESARKAGIEWGGYWTDFRDISHFQDSSLSIPPEKYFWDRNMCIDFVKKYNNGGIDGTEHKLKLNVNMNPLLLVALGYIGYKTLFKKGGRK